MQSPSVSAPRSGSSCLKVAVGLCGCLLVLGVLAAVGIFMTVKQALHKTPLTAAQTLYVGSWQGEDGSALVIRQDGGADMKSGGTTVQNGQVTINDNTHTLEIKIFGIGKSWHIDTPPHNKAGNVEMTLSGTAFQSVPPFPPGTFNTSH